MNNALAQAVGQELGHELSKALERIQHCLDQLTDEQIWWRSTENMNSIGNLLLHLTGNVRQWIICGLGNTPDDRNRPAEFTARGTQSKADLWARLHATVEEARTTLASQTADDWLRRRRIQGFDVTGLGAAFDSVPHFRGHTQEIIHLTRTILGDRYRFAWVPTTPEEGGAASGVRPTAPL